MDNFLFKLRTDFENQKLHNEDDVKIHFWSEILKPFQLKYNLSGISSEHNYINGGKSDATFSGIPFEYKPYDYFKFKNSNDYNNKHVNEALVGRNKDDRGLYHYIINTADINKDGNDFATNEPSDIENKLTQIIGIGFDGKSFVFCRFIKSLEENLLDTSKLKIKFKSPLHVKFDFEICSFDNGLFKLDLILKQTSKITLSKVNLLNEINTKSEFVRSSVKNLYSIVCLEIQHRSRVKTLFDEWNRVFGTVYGDESEETDFTSYSQSLKEAYNWEIDLDVKLALFSLQTFYNIYLKLFIFKFLNEMISSGDSVKNHYTSIEITQLFEGKLLKNNLIDNFFEIHFLEWFTFLGEKKELNKISKVVDDILESVNRFDVTTFYLKPELLQDILQEVYMELIPKELRHLMGEYFSPDWIVEHCLDILGYDGDINKRIVDPTCGSGTFLTHAIKIIRETKTTDFSLDDLLKISQNVVGFDINPISIISAKANIILSLFSNTSKQTISELVKKTEQISIPVYIADSVLAPIVYSETASHTFKVKTSVGDFVLPKFHDLKTARAFLKLLNEYIETQRSSDMFWINVQSLKLLPDKYKNIAKKLFERIFFLHRISKDSFWTFILSNNFAPILITQKFDYVVGNPPWIAWKAMSKSYRAGSLDIWISYGIFEKSAYDKKTAHDDFGMAVTYVSIDQYLKDNGNMVFLLPASFLKSEKGGEGFRKFEITRNNMTVPFSIKRVDDFSNVKLFSIPTIAIVIKKNERMIYPLNDYNFFSQKTKNKFDSHRKWKEIEGQLSITKNKAKPVNENEPRSSWLTMKDFDFADKILIGKNKQFYKGRKGIEPAGAKGVYILKKPIKACEGVLKIENDMSRQRRADVKKLGARTGKVEDKYIFPMLGGRNISKWKVKSCEYMVVPHTAQYKYGIPEKKLTQETPLLSSWLNYYRKVLLDTRIQNGKFFNEKTNPYYRLDNVGKYTFSKYKVLWKEQTGSMSAVVVSNYLDSIPNAQANLFTQTNKPIVYDSKVLGLCLDNENEAHFVCGIINAYSVVNVIDSYAIATNRGVDVLKNLYIPVFDKNNALHLEIAKLSIKIHEFVKLGRDITALEKKLDEKVQALYNLSCKKDK